MFKKGQKVIYPKHGAGKIIAVQEETISGEKKKYYKIQFLNSQVSVSVPQDHALDLGLRYPLTKTNIKKVLKKLNTQYKINKNTLVNLDTLSRDKLNSGKLEEVIDLVNLLHSLAKQKEEENKNFSYSYSDRLEIAMDFIKSEVALVLGQSALKKYGLK